MSKYRIFVNFNSFIYRNNEAFYRQIHCLFEVLDILHFIKKIWQTSLWMGVRLDTIPKLYKSKQDEIPKSLTNHQICKI